MRIDHLAVVLPAYNEAEGISGFVDELLEHLQPLASRVSVVIVDDRSTDTTPEVLRELAEREPRVRVVTAERNRGHGPTALAAYRTGLELDPDVILHVDGDGQFLGADAAAVVAALDDDTDAVRGVRRGRSDPWFRTVLTRGVRSMVAALTGRGVADVNTPLRAYRPAVLRQLLQASPDEALVPHVHFSLAEARRGLRVREIEVASIPRRGAEATGTMWGQQRNPRLPPARLVDFSRSAAGEVWQHSVRPALTPSAIAAAVAVLLLLVAYVVVVARSMVLPLWEDEAFNLTVPLNLVRGLGYSSDGILSFGELAPFDPRISTGPVMLLPIAGLLGLGADPVVAGRVVALLFFAVLLVALFALGRRVGG
ncbi:MAG TPA: glycosyltransferase family 2 protein, partial [Rhodoglobus sp.]|nr:glycosyltransferase family 2 protein [Rhodoglobus sp.]